jgi:hypothetical protein
LIGDASGSTSATGPAALACSCTWTE